MSQMRQHERHYIYERSVLMQNRTKKDLEAALKRLLADKPLNRLTINELAGEAGISRMTFYYHFRDIYDLVEWICLEDAREALQGKRTYLTWKEGLLQIFEAVYENKSFILNVYRCVDRAYIERFLSGLVADLIEGVVNEQAEGLEIPGEKKHFIATFYMYSFVGIMLDWIASGMRENYCEIVEDIATTMKGNISGSIYNYCPKN